MGWQDNIMGAVTARPRNRQSTKSPFGPAMKPLKFAATDHYMRYIHAAATIMDVNRSSYVRRVLAVHAAHVLQVPVRLILWETPRTLPMGQYRSPQTQALGFHDTGEGIESWCPHPGCDGAHLAVPNSGQGTGLP